MNREQIIARIREIKADRTSLIAQLADSDGIRARLQQERDELRSSADRWRALAEMTLWAELDSGASIKVGDRVRYMLRTYECTADHTKALTRRPTVTEYWKEVST